MKLQIKPLTPNEVEKSRKEHGENVLTRQKQKSFISRFFSNLNDPVIRILLVALVVNLICAFRGGGWLETLGIAVAVFLAAFISTLSEHSSQAAFAKLESDGESAACRVRRSEGVLEIPFKEVVVGDILLLSAGDIVAADAELISGELSIDQSAMTGESKEVKKYPEGDYRNDPSDPSSVFGGCAVLSGQSEAVVRTVGDATFLGQISREIQQSTRESPLRVRLTKLAGQISRIGYVMAAMVVLAYLFNVFVLDSGFKGEVILLKLANVSYMLQKLMAAFTLGLTVIVMAVPEGLPMMIAVLLSSNLRKMMRDNVLVRKAVGIEAAGSMNILFTDKTGTLTEGHPGLGALLLGDGQVLRSPEEMAGRASEMFSLSGRYNTVAELGSDGCAVGGNAADRVLLENSSPIGAKVLSRVAFDSERKCSNATVVFRGERLELIKGAPEVILPRIRRAMTANGDVKPFSAERFLRKLKDFTSRGGRMLLIAFSRAEERELTLVCAVELIDRERPEARSAVEDLQSAGVRVVMITGDNRDTARSIAERCGIVSSADDVCLTSDELARLSDHRLKELLPSLAVVARALPTDKSRLVRVAQEAGLVVGMTGDGVNDAPALRRSDVGFAMGTGSGVAKEAGDIVILDNNLASIVKAVLYGRTVFKSIRKFITLQLTMNLCACGVSMIGPFVGVDSPVTVVQMLWINVIMDTLGGLAFAGEPPRRRYLKEAPKRRDEPILNSYMVNSLLLHGGFTLALSIVFLKLPSVEAGFRTVSGDLCHLTAFFAFFIFSSVLNCINARTDRLNIFSDIEKNRVFILIMMAICAIQIAFIYLGGSVLRTMPLTPVELGRTLLYSLAVIPAEFLRKLIWRLSGRKNGY